MITPKGFCTLEDVLTYTTTDKLIGSTSEGGSVVDRTIFNNALAAVEQDIISYIGIIYQEADDWINTTVPPMIRMMAALMVPGEMLIRRVGHRSVYIQQYNEVLEKLKGIRDGYIAIPGATSSKVAMYSNTADSKEEPIFTRTRYDVDGSVLDDPETNGSMDVW